MEVVANTKLRCPLCVPRGEDNEHWRKVKTLSVSTLYLHKIQTYKGYSVLVFDLGHQTKLSELSVDELSRFCNDLQIAQVAIENAVKCDHVNIASLGNEVDHLHWHIIPRFKNDGRWGKPIWMTSTSEMEIEYLSSEMYGQLHRKIQDQFTC